MFSTVFNILLSIIIKDAYYKSKDLYYKLKTTKLDKNGIEMTTQKEI
jgi:hypothetical protein